MPIDVCENALLHFWKLHNTSDTHSTVVSTLTHTWLQGKVVAVTNAWALLFFSAVDCGLLCNLPSEKANCDGDRSFDDPPCMGHVPSIEAGPVHSSHVICCPHHRLYSFLCLQSAVRYVDSG